MISSSEISIQKQVLDELQQSEARFRAIFENAAVGIGILGLDRRVIDANPALCRMYGRSLEELIGQTPALVTHPDDYAQSTQDFQELISGQVDSYQSERRYVHKNGEMFWAHVTMSYVRNAKNTPLYIIGMVLDIDDRKRAQLDLRQSEERFRATFESSAIGMGLLAPDGKILKVNQAVCKMSGYSAEELLQRYDHQNVYPEDLEVDRDLYAELLAVQRDSYEVEKRYLRKNGEAFWARLNISAVRSPDQSIAYLVAMIEDISVQKRTWAELQETETRFRVMFENAGIGIGLVGLDRHPIEVNAALLRMTGYSADELYQRTGVDLGYPEDAEIGVRELQAVLEGKLNSYQIEKRYIRKNGQIYWVRLTNSVVRTPGGEPQYLVSMIEDIDAQKQMWAELQESEARFRAIFENVAVGVAIMSLDRKPLAVNPVVEQITGYQPEEILNVDPVSLVIPEDREIDTTPFQEMIAGKRNSYVMERRYRRKDGRIIWARVNYSLVRDPDGKPNYLVGMIEDIDEHKRSIEELRESEARFRILYDTADLGIVLVDLGEDGDQPLDETRFDQLVANQQLNPAMLRMFGYTAEELQNTPIASLIYPADQGIDEQQFRQLLKGEIDFFRVEKRFVRKNGSVFWGLLTDSLARTSEGTPRMVIGIIQDINEERQAKEQLAAQEAEYRQTLEQKVEERTHELTQINQRLGEEIAQRQLAEQALAEKAAQDAILSERTRLARDLHDAVTQTLFSSSLIAEVLPDLWESNPEEGKRRLEELRQLTRGALAEMRTLLVELRPNSLVQIPLPDLLRQLCEALIGRARLPIQFTADGQTKIPADVQIALYRITQEALNNIIKHAKATKVVVSLQMGETIRLMIVDDGSGFNLDAVSPDHLGLKIMCERAESIGAHCSIYSQPGEGTQISVLWQSENEKTKG